MRVRLNWKVHIHGRGAVAHAARSLLAALVSCPDVELSIEDLAANRAPKVVVPPALAPEYEALAARRIDPRRFWHIRQAAVQEEERHLLHGRVDVSPFGRNIWYLTPETSRYGIVPREIYTTYLTRAWVPSTHSARALAGSGIPADMIDVVPHGVDTGAFRPPEVPPDVPRDARRYAFLTVINATGWKRKGLDVLVRGYLAAFRPSDDVVLVIHSRKGADAIGGVLADAGYRAGGSPEIEVRAGRVDSIAERYQEADCYVQPTRGEAFGLAILEAMACGLPVIVPRWGGHLDFCADTCGLLIDTTLSPVERDPDRRGEWAEPSVEHLAYLMRTVHADRGLGRRLGEQARAVATRWSWERAARVAVEAATAAEERLC